MYVLLKTDNNAYELFPNYVPPSPFASKSGGHDPHSSYGSAAPAPSPSPSIPPSSNQLGSLGSAVSSPS